jgi:hypothetical protein
VGLRLRRAVRLLDKPPQRRKEAQMRNQEESRMQQAAVKWFRYQYPDTIITSFPNQGARSVANASRMKAEGMTAGMPDLVIFKPFVHFGAMCMGALFVEFKTEKGTLTPKQHDVHKKLTDNLYRVVVCRSVDEFINEVTKYME